MSDPSPIFEGCETIILVAMDVHCVFALLHLQYLAFTCGLLSGALTNLGICCQISAEVTTMPACEEGPVCCTSLHV